MSVEKCARRIRVQVSVANWRHNLGHVRRLLAPGVRLMAVVKADAYGHGLVPFGLAAQQEGADWLGVALAEEGRQLRQAGIHLPILVFGVLNQPGMDMAAAYRLTVTLADPGCVVRAQAAAEKARLPVEAHLKLDTGMNRIGARTRDEVDAVLSALRVAPLVKLTGVFTHLSDADGPDPTYTDGQLKAFDALCAPLPAGLIRHAAASSAVLTRQDSHYDMVRPGICLYGCPPVATQASLKPCLSFIGEVAFVKEVPQGSSIGYGRAHVTAKPTVVATIAAGYGDGYPRALSGKGWALIRGVSCPVLGRVCMDQLMVDASQVPGLQVGDDAVLLGSQGKGSITAQELAWHAGTITYEILLSPTPRVPRQYDEIPTEETNAG